MKIDGLVIDRTRKPHMLWLGPTGSGKSSAVAVTRVDGKRPTLIATPDLSDPLIASTLRLGGFRWTACVSTTPIDFLIGTPHEVAERLTEVFRSGGQGTWKRTARMATAAVITQLDLNRQTRSLKAIGESLLVRCTTDKELKMRCYDWCSRFLDLHEMLGPSIGAGGLDIADLLRQGKTVLLDNDAFNHTALGGDIVALALSEAKRCADLVPGGFRLIFEEAGQLGERVDLAEPFHRAGRRRNIAVDDLTQAESDMNEGINANVATRAYFAQELKSLQRVAADRLGLEPRKLDPSSMKDFTAWIAHGRIRRLVKFPKPAALPSRDAISRELRTDVNGHQAGQSVRKRYEIIELKRDELPALPGPKGLHALIAQNLYRDGECERWRGDHNADGYGRVRLPDGSRVYIHRLRWELAYGPIGLDENGNRLTIDHRRTCYKDCSRPDHLELITRSENSRRRWRVRGFSRV